MSDLNPRIITPELVCSFPNLLIARTIEGAAADAKPKFGITLLAYPDKRQKYLPGTADLTPMRKIATAVAREFFGDKLAGLIKAGKFRSPFLEDQEQCEKWGWPEGTIIIRTSSIQKPGVVSCVKDVDGKPKLMTPEEIEDRIYPGARVRCSLRAYAYDKAGNKGVAFGLQNVQWLGEDERIDNRVNVKDAFEATVEAEDVADLDAPGTASAADAEVGDLL